MHVLGTQKNCLNGTVLLSTQNICKNRFTILCSKYLSISTYKLFNDILHVGLVPVQPLPSNWQSLFNFPFNVKPFKQLYTAVIPLEITSPLVMFGGASQSEINYEHIIWIYHKCEWGIEKSVLMITVLHHESWRVVTNIDCKVQIFYLILTQIMDSFLLTIKYHNCIFKKGSQKFQNTLRCDILYWHHFNKAMV